MAMLDYRRVTLMPPWPLRSIVRWFSPFPRHQAQAEGLDLFAQAPILVTWILEVYFPKDPWDGTVDLPT